MVTRTEYLTEYFTERGQKALENRLANLLRLSENQVSYPMVAKMYGFGTLVVQNKEQLLGMIENLKQILMIQQA